MELDIKCSICKNFYLCEKCEEEKLETDEHPIKLVKKKNRSKIRKKYRYKRKKEYNYEILSNQKDLFLEIKEFNKKPAIFKILIKK